MNLRHYILFSPFLLSISAFAQQKMSFGLNVQSFSLFDHEHLEEGDFENKTVEGIAFRVQGFVNTYTRSRTTFLHASVLYFAGKRDEFESKNNLNTTYQVKERSGKQYGGIVGIGQDVYTNKKYSFQSLFRVGYIYSDGYKRESIEGNPDGILRKSYLETPFSHEINAQIQLKFNYRLYKKISLSVGVNNSLIMNLRKGDVTVVTVNYDGSEVASTEKAIEKIKESDWRTSTIRGFFGITYNL